MTRPVHLLVLLLVLLASPASAQDILEYAVREGETCGVIARRMYGHSRRYDLIHEHNPELGPMPHRLRAGQIIRLPQVEVSDNADATVTSVRRTVQSQRPRAADWGQTAIGQELFEGWRVSTGEQSSAELTFRESSVASIRQETLVIVYGGEARRVRNEGARAVVREGALLSRLSALSGGQPLEVETPTAVATLDDGEASVHVERGGRTRVANHRGRRVRVRSSEGTDVVEVPEGQGTRIDRGAAPTPPQPLPQAPRWVPDQPVRYLAIRGLGGTLAGAWQPMSGAQSYRVEVARRADGRDMLASAVVPAEVTQFEFHRLPPADYFVRVCTLDADGFEGRPDEPGTFELVGVTIVQPGDEPPSASGPDDILADLDGLGDVDFAADVPARVPVLVGSRLVAPESVVCAVGDSAPSRELVFSALGDLHLTCVDAAGQNIVGIDVAVVSVTMRVLSADGRESPTLVRGQTTPLIVELEGGLDSGELALVGGEALEVESFAARAEGGFDATVRARADGPQAVELRLARRDAVLVAASLGTRAAPPPPEPRAWAVHEGLGLAAFASAVGVVDERRHGHSMWLGLHFQSARIGELDARLRTTAGLRVSLLDERVRIGAQVPLDVVGQSARLADRGSRDVLATLSTLIVDDGAVGLAAEAGIWIPTAGDQTESPGLRHARLRIAADFSVRFAERFTLRTRQAGIFDLVGSESILWASAYAFDVGIAGPFSLGLEGTVTMGEEDAATWFAGGVGLAVGLDFTPVFVSVIGRYGFGDDLLSEATLGANVRGSFDL